MKLSKKSADNIHARMYNERVFLWLRSTLHAFTSKPIGRP